MPLDGWSGHAAQLNSGHHVTLLRARMLLWCRLLFRLVDPATAAPFMKQNLTKREMAKVQKQLGQSYRVLLGNPTGHYTLDLGVQQDRCGHV